MASSKETYCLCGQPYNIGQFMIECDCCREWFHGSCVAVKIYNSDDIDKYHCPKCSQTYGPSVLKIPTNNHRSDRYELSAETRPSQVGTPAWVRALAARPLRPTQNALQRMRGNQFTEEFVRDNGFTKPVFFHSPEGLEMKMPNPSTFTVRSVLRYCGATLEVEVIDVRKQSTLRMPLGDFIDYFETPPEHRDEKVLNVLSLEFSDTNMSQLVEPPLIARSLDWASRVWPSADERPPRPAVQKYCLMSAAGSYTDFHVDFGGTTVWYHVLHGRKIFYLVPPTATNLALYQQWSASNNQNERFFGDMVEWYGTVELAAGQSVVIPSGWLHAVLTPCDALVFGGNLLHSYAIEMQLQIYEIERRVETPTMFRYPLFEAMHWYACAHLLTLLRRYNEETQDEDFTVSETAPRAPPAPPAPLLLRGVKILANALKEWHALKTTDAAKRDNVPKCLNSGQLVRELGKELRALEKRCAGAAARDRDYKIKNNSPTKSNSRKQNTQKKSLKLTLPKPIMHMGQNGEYEDKMYSDKYYIDKEIAYQDNTYLQDIKYVTEQKFVDNKVLPDAKYIVDKQMVLPEAYYEDPVQGYQDRNGFDREKKTVLKIKMDNPPRTDPPPYSLPSHSILKSHLIRHERSKPSAQQWTISKKDIGDYHDDQILFTNDNLQPEAVEACGAGMYSAEDIQQDYHYLEGGKPPYQPEYGYPSAPYADHYRRFDVQPTNAYPEVGVEEVSGAYPAPAHTQLPTYDAAIAQQFTTNYVIEEPKPAPAVRRSERPARRRVSSSYAYGDELLLDEGPAPARRRPRQPPPRPRPQPANGIESLIQASVLAEVEQPHASETEDAAVEGMLSISSRYATPAPRTFGLAADTADAERGPPQGSKRSRKPAAAAPPALEEDDLREVHRDDQYVYPSLEMSSEEDEEWAAPPRRARRRPDKDESWSPRARVGRVTARARVPARAGVRRECVRAALHAAAARVPRGKRARPPLELIQNAKRAVLATKSKRPPPPVQPTPNNKNSRLKKGMKTAKQRLGKILKIHKMMH